MIWKILSITNNYLDKDEKEEVYIKIKKKDFNKFRWKKMDEVRLVLFPLFARYIPQSFSIVFSVIKLLIIFQY